MVGAIISSIASPTFGVDPFLLKLRKVRIWGLASTAIYAAQFSSPLRSFPRYWSLSKASMIPWLYPWTHFLSFFLTVSRSFASLFMFGNQDSKCLLKASFCFGENPDSPVKEGLTNHNLAYQSIGVTICKQRMSVSHNQLARNRHSRSEEMIVIALSYPAGLSLME